MNICSWCRKRALATSAGRQVLESEGKNSAAAKLGQDGVCCLCLGIKEGLEKILMNAWDGACNEGIGFESFRVSIGQPEKSSMIEQGLLVKAGYAKFKPLKNELNPLAGNLFAKISGKKYLQWGGGADAVLKIDLDGKKAVLHPEPVFIFGRYEKFLDSIGQTSWICNRCAGAGCKACGNTSSGYSDSVHSQIEAGLVANTFKRTFLHASGREDVDVKAMGTGRPFVLEVQRPIRRDIDLRNMADAINKKGVVAVHGLACVNGGFVQVLKNSRFDKHYKAWIDLGRRPESLDLDGIKTLEGRQILQQTPARVLGKRPDLLRKRRVISIKSSVVEGLIIAEIYAECGTYIKELVNSDGGRTRPSIAGLTKSKAQCRRLVMSGVEDVFLETCLGKAT